MKQLKTTQELMDNIGKKVKFKFDGIDKEGFTQFDGTEIGFVFHEYREGFLIDNNCFNRGTSYIKDVFLLDEEEKKPSRIKHTYTTTFTRDDGVQFTKDSIDGVSIDSLKEQEQKHYEEARAIRAKLNAHSKLKF